MIAQILAVRNIKSLDFYNLELYKAIMNETPVKTKPQYELQVPSGEFTMKDLVRQTGKSQPFLHLKLKKLLAAGKVSEARRERGHTGRAAIVYKSA